MSWLEAVAVVVSALGIWLTTRRSLWSWPIIIVACLLYGEVFRESGLYSDMLLQGVFAVCAVYGWWNWARDIQSEGSLSVIDLNWRGWLWGLMSGVVGSVLLGYGMARFTHASLPWLDSALTAFSLVAQWWQARKYLANWWLWIVVDVIYIGEYWYKHLALTAGLYGLFVVLAGMGLRNWQSAVDRKREGNPAAVTL